MEQTRTDGCRDKTPPVENKRITIQHELYFALPNGRSTTSNWGVGGVAFIHPKRDATAKTYCRMWKISKQQYDDVREQEGRSWYGKEVSLGEDGGVSIYTITNDVVLSNVVRPSEAYIRTLVLGLKETFAFNDKEIVNYLIDKQGIRTHLQIHALETLVASL